MREGHKTKKSEIVITGSAHILELHFFENFAKLNFYAKGRGVDSLIVCLSICCSYNYTIVRQISFIDLNWTKMSTKELETYLSEVGSSNQLETNNSKYVSHVKKLLYRRMLVGISDGRFFLGTFYCIDKQGNIILQDAVEYRSTRRSAPSPMEQRVLGLILIPSLCRKTCHVDCSIDEQLSLMSLGEQKS